MTGCFFFLLCFFFFLLLLFSSLSQRLQISPAPTAFDHTACIHTYKHLHFFHTCMGYRNRFFLLAKQKVCMSISQSVKQLTNQQTSQQAIHTFSEINSKKQQQLQQLFILKAWIFVVWARVVVFLFLKFFFSYCFCLSVLYFSAVVVSWLLLMVLLRDLLMHIHTHTLRLDIFVFWTMYSWF